VDDVDHEGERHQVTGAGVPGQADRHQQRQAEPGRGPAIEAPGPGQQRHDPEQDEPHEP
jgi:hypothetical protein